MPIVGASTKTVQDGLTRAQNELKGIAIGVVDGLDISNEIYQIVGTSSYYDWSEAAGTTFGTTKDVQDYANVPADFRRLKAAWRTDDSSTFTPMVPLAIREQLQRSNIRRPALAISQEYASFRLDAKSDQTRTGTGQWAIVFDYYKMPKRLGSLVDLFEFDDSKFEVYASGIVARAAEFIKDERAGQWGGRNNVGQFVGSGLWGKFAALLNNMVREDELASGVQVYAPLESLFM